MSLDSISNYSELQNAAAVQGVNSRQMPDKANMPEDMPPPPPMGDVVGLSEMGSLLSEAQKSGDASSEELQEFGKSIFESLRDGSFNAEELAENAPEALKKLAEEKGIDLVSAIGDMAEQIEEMKPPKGMMPPGGMGGMPPMPPENEENEDSQVSFYDTLNTVISEDEEA